MSTMKTTSEVASELLALERECAIRYEAIKSQLDSGSKRFDKIDRWIMGLYATIVGLSLTSFIY